MIGDYNGRLSSLQPNHYSMHPDSNNDLISTVTVPPRRCMDSVVNSNGRKILDLMTNYDLLIANGHVMADNEGKYTCCTYNDLSVNDIYLFHRDLLRHIVYFKVDDNFQWYSDHRYI